MDPITAVGFAASILTFIDYSHQVISGTLEVIKSGSTSENAHVSVVIDDLYDITKELNSPLSGNSKHAEALNTLASDCRGLSEDLQKLLEKLRVTGESSKWKSVKLTLRSMWKKGDVAELESRLNKYRSQILLRLVLILNERQTLVQVQLNSLHSESQKQSSNVVEQLASLRNTVLEAAKQTISHSEKPNSLQGLAEQMGLVKDIRSTLDTLLESSAPPSLEMRILKQVYFKSVYSREDTMEKADCGTFEWLLEEDLPDSGRDAKDEGSSEDEESSENGWSEDEGSKNGWSEDEGSKNGGSEDEGSKNGGSEDEGSENGGSENEGSEDEKSKEGESGREETKADEIQRKRRSQARSTFLTWLRTGNHVFHVSGKAGSGKSTLMKLLLDHPRTREELNRWAGGKQLVFAHFFFWRSGDNLQRSLEGLHRSILFETLKQCPDLIPEVFPEAYSTFSTVRQENSIDELLFRPEDFGKALQRLIHKSPNPGYRFCFFIDGLDEYGEDGADRLDHETLAESLELWANKDDIKILVSSRPHREFQSAFSDELRIKLHDLTKLDIARFGRNMFEKDKNFSRVEHCYKGLVDKVVNYSDGVFLWARLAIRSLLMAVGRREAVDSLEKQLDNIPKDINDFYEKLLGSISPSDRIKSFKMLLLAGQLRGNLVPIALTWIDNLDDPKFPTSYKIEPYTEEDIRERELAAELQIDYYTKGLLEIRTYPNDNSKFIFNKRVQFFHRTLRDFVSHSQQLRAFSAEYPAFGCRQARMQTLLAGLWFAKTKYITANIFYMLILDEFASLPSGESRDAWFDAYARVLDYHHQSGNTSFRGWFTSPGEEWKFYRSRIDGTQLSFPHWVTWRLGDLDYVLSKQAKTPHLLSSKNDLSFLLSAAINKEESPALQRLLDLGVSPNEQVKVSRKYRTTTVWRVFCVFFAVRMIRDRTEKANSLYLRRLSEFLATGVVDTNCFILLALGKDPRDYKGDPTHVISLAKLIQQLDPLKWKAFSRLMSYPGSGIFASVRNAWRYLLPSETHQSFRPEKYLPYTLDMPPPPREKPDSEDSNADSPDGDMFLVHSIRWRDSELVVKRLEVRIY